jgi:histone acetyltransferase
VFCDPPRPTDYISAPHWIREQRKKVVDKLLELSTSHIKYKGFSEFKAPHNVQRIAMDRLQVLLDVGWNPKPYQDLMSNETQQKIFKINDEFLSNFKNDKDAWPFLTAVSREEVKDYYEVIKDPIDLGMMDARMKKGGYYVTQEMLVADLKRMMENCKTYNPSGNMFHEIATRLEKKYLEKWKPVPLV